MARGGAKIALPPYVLAHAMLYVSVLRIMKYSKWWTPYIRVVDMGEVHCLATTEARFKALTEIEKRFSILNILSIEPKSHRMISGNWFIDPSL